MLPGDPGKGVGKLQTILPRFLWYPEGRTVLQARKCQLGTRLHRIGLIPKVVFTEAEAVHRSRRQGAGPRDRSRLKAILRTLPLRRRADRPRQSAGGNIVFLLRRIAEG